jgi:hypothetical protein
MRRARRAVVVAAAAPFLACAPQEPPPIERSRDVAASPDEAHERIDRELRSLGFVPGRGGDYVKSSAVPEAWATCETVMTRGGSDGSSQRDLARPQSRSASVSVSLVPSAGGTQVSIGASFEGLYHHRFRNVPFTAACGSTGQLERLLLDAAG